METGVKNSFIPHDVTQAARDARMREGSLLDLAVLMSIVLLIASVVLAGGVFGYQQLLEKRNKDKLDQVKKAKQEFSQEFIHQATRLDDRMREADKILNNHIAPSVFFDMLEKNTLTTVSFSSLDIKEDSESSLSINMDGIAESVNSIALQADLFGKGGFLISPMFSDINRQLEGVRFSFSATANMSSMRYAKSEAGATGGLAPAQFGSPYASPASPSTPQTINQQ